MTSPRFRPATVRTNGRAHKWSKSKITVFHLFFSSCIFISLFSYINQMDRSFLNVVAPPDILETDQWHHIIIYTRAYRSHPAPQQWQQTYGASHSWPLRVNGCREVLCQRRIYINVIMLHYYVYYTRDIIIIIIIIIWWSLSCLRDTSAIMWNSVGIAPSRDTHALFIGTAMSPQFETENKVLFPFTHALLLQI